MDKAYYKAKIVRLSLLKRGQIEDLFDDPFAETEEERESRLADESDKTRAEKSQEQISRKYMLDKERALDKGTWKFNDSGNDAYFDR